MSIFGGLFKTIGGIALGRVGVLTGQRELVTMGIGETVSGIGTLISGNNKTGKSSTTTRNTIQPGKLAYGRCRVPSTLIYQNTWGQNDNYIDLVMDMHDHPCALGIGGEAIAGDFPQVFADLQRLTVNTTNVDSLGADTLNGHLPGALPGSGTTYNPAQTVVNISAISRSAEFGAGSDVVTVTLASPIPYLQSGDQIKIQNVGSGSNEAVNGTFQVSEVLATNGTTGWTTKFTYLCGGPAFAINNQGQAVTLWVKYSNLINIEWLDGTQTLGTTFQLAARKIDDSSGNNIPNPWTNYCSAVGHTLVMLRLYYNKTYFPTGTYPEFSFLIRGKNNIYDPRLGPLNADGSVNPAYCAYTENAALCIADFLSIPEEYGGYGLSYGSQIPLDALISSANICDLPVPLAAGGTEPLYALNGSVDLDKPRGDILNDLLTACAGRVSLVGGQYFIQVGYWDETQEIPNYNFMSLMGEESFQWKPAPNPRELYNAVKGTYLSPDNQWTQTDAPYYAQDHNHGYDPGNLLPQYGGDINLATDGGERRWLDVHLPFTISAATAQRLFKIELLRRRWFGTGTFAFTMPAYQIVPLDIVSANLPFLGWSGKLLEAQNTRLNLHKVETGVRFSVEIDFKEIDSSIYQWSVEEELTPQGYIQGNFFSQNYTETEPFPWSPGYASPLSGDAIGGAATFGLQVIYAGDAAGNASTTIQVKGTPPLTPDLDLSGPELQCTPGSGGSIPAGNYALALAAYNSGDVQTQQQTQYLDIIKVSVPANGAINYTALWGSGNDGGALYMATDPGVGIEAYVWHFQQTVSPGDDLGMTTGTITSFNESTPGGPDRDFSMFGWTLQEVIHSGCWAQQVVSVTSNTVTIGAPGFTANQWNGYTLSLLSRAQYFPGETVSTLNPELIVLNMPVESNTATNGQGEVTFTIGTNYAGQQLPDLTTLINVNDLLVARSQFTFTTNSMADPNIANGLYPDGATGVEVGHLAVVMSGADYGDVVPISGVSQDSNGKYTIFNLANNWQVTPTTGDIVVIIDPNSAGNWSGPKISLANGSGGPTTIAKLTVDNLAYQTWLVTVQCDTAGGTQNLAQYSPMRDVYIAGSQGTRTITSSTTMVATDGIVLADCTNGNIVYTLLSSTVAPNQEMRVTKIDTSTHTCTIACASGDTINGQSTIVLTTQWDFQLFTIPAE